MEELVASKFKEVEKRIDKLEDNYDEFRSIAMSVQKLAINMEHMLAEVRKQGERLDRLEKEPAEYWNGMKRTILNTCIGAVAGALAVGLLQMIAKLI